MKINRELLDKIAHLARLEFNEKDAEKMIEDMNAIVGWVEKLQEVDTEGVEPLTTMSHEINVFRDDVARQTLSKQEVLANAPDRDDSFFRVPKVID